MDPLLTLAELHLSELRRTAARERLGAQVRRAQRRARTDAPRASRPAAAPRPAAAACATC